MTAPTETPKSTAEGRRALVKAARDAMDALMGHERVEVIRHYHGSASKAYPRRVTYTRCGCCDCCECGTP